MITELLTIIGGVTIGAAYIAYVCYRHIASGDDHLEP